MECDLLEAFLFLYETVASILSTWIYIVSTNSMINKTLKHFLRLFLYFLMFFFVILFALTILFTVIVFPNVGIVYSVVLAVLVILLVSQFGITAFCGFKVLAILKDQVHMSVSTKMVAYKVTKAMLLLVVCFLAIIFSLIGYLITTIAIESYTPQAYLAIDWILNTFTLLALATNDNQRTLKQEKTIGHD